MVLPPSSLSRLEIIYFATLRLDNGVEFTFGYTGAALDALLGIDHMGNLFLAGDGADRTGLDTDTAADTFVLNYGKGQQSGHKPAGQRLSIMCASYSSRK